MNQKISHDYGIKPKMFLLGDMNFIQSFQEAKCVGMAYVHAVDENDNFFFQLGFIFENKKPASLFLDTLLRWCNNSDDHDAAIGIDFISKQNGEYTLAIYNKQENIIERLVSSEIRSKVIPVLIHAIHYKEIDTSESFNLFKEKYTQGSPVPIGFFIGNEKGIKSKSEKHITKRSFNFYNITDENDEAFSLNSYRRIKSKNETAKLTQPLIEHQSIEEIEQHRLDELKLYFPLTYNKLTKLSWLADVYNTLSLKYHNVLVIQAICNLILGERLKLEIKLQGNFLKRNQAINILEYLNSNYESFKSFFPKDIFFTKYKVESQINRDKKELSQALNQK